MTYEQAVRAIPPGRYRHFKGRDYEVLYIARHSEDGSPLVVYRALYGERGIWVRPAQMWNETVVRDGTACRRFCRLDRIERVERYERLFDAARACPDAEKLRQLEAYYTSGDWREDYLADENGELPPSLKRGVLSQDALYDFLQETTPVGAVKGENPMDLIPSFSVDHTRIVPGIFTSRVDAVAGGTVTTYDVRLTHPNTEPAVDVAAMHSLEHIVATFLRNDPDWKDEVVYWGPMGCLTGFYLILKGSRPSREICDLLLRAFRSVQDAQSVPGATPANCGNYLMHNLAMAKWYAARFADYLTENADKPGTFEYPQTRRPVTEEGQHFYDS